MDLLFPIFQMVCSCKRLFFEIGLFCDYFALWGLAFAMFLPLEFAYDEAKSSSYKLFERYNLNILYIIFGLNLLSKSLYFLSFVRRAAKQQQTD